MVALLPVSENYPHFLSRVLAHPRKAWRAFTHFQEMPSYLWMEITNRCNLRCRACSKPYGHYDSSTDMSLELFDHVFEEVAPHLKTLNLTGIGESLCHREFDAIWSRVSRNPALEVWITTNGSFLTPEWIERFARRKVHLIFSIDGADAETHQFNRRGSNWDQICEALARAQKLEAASDNPAVFPFQRHINHLVMRHNLRQMPEMIDLAARYNVRDIRFSLLQDWGLPAEFWEEQNPLNERKVLSECLEKARMRAEEKQVRLIAPHVDAEPAAAEPSASGKHSLRLFRPSPASQLGYPRYEDRHCAVPFYGAYVAVDGKTSICCGSWHSITLGDARTSSIRKIWRGLAFRRIRAGMAIGAHTSFCRMCDLPCGLSGGAPPDNT